MEFIRDFSKIGKNDADKAGGKGASLGEMTNVGIQVPPGFVVLADAFEKFLEETDLNVEIDSILHGVDVQAMHTVEEASEEIQRLIKSAKMPKDITLEILNNFKTLNSDFVAVRSSATAEDSASAAWAGQLDSYLNTTRENVLERVQDCWASLFTPRAIFYRFELHEKTRAADKTRNKNNTRIHAESEKVSVAVVVQKMVNSEKSGIAFSVHPVTEDYNQIIIEAGFGLGEAIVSGQITPDSYVVEKNSSDGEPSRTTRRIIDVNVVEQERGLFRKVAKKGSNEDTNHSPIRTNGRMMEEGELEKEEESSNGGNEWRELGDEGKEQVLSGKEILELTELILKIEKHYGFPCDIEWAWEDGKFYIVQSRPITTLSKNDKKT